MYKTLIVEPQEFSLNALIKLPVWKDGKDGFVCSDTASNGLDALDLLKKNSYDLILTEINLPLFDGLQLLKAIHKDNVPPLIVFISDIVSFSYAREGFIYGAFDYLPKPVNQESILKLFERARTELHKQKSSASAANMDSDFQSCFSPQMLSGFVTGYSNVPVALNDFEKALGDLYRTDNHANSTDALVNRLFSTITEEIFQKSPWLTNYLPKDFYKQIDYLILHDSKDFIAFYVRKLKQLYDLINLLRPSSHDEMVVEIHHYILNNPEEDLKLSSIARKFYLNQTYLSNLFSKKSDVGYSHLITIVKLKRAEYLLNNSTLPVAEIASRLGYKDISYFTRLYKKFIGKAPSEYMHEDVLNYSI